MRTVAVGRMIGKDAILAIDVVVNQFLFGAFCQILTWLQILRMGRLGCKFTFHNLKHLVISQIYEIKKTRFDLAC